LTRLIVNLKTAVEQPQGTQRTQGWELEDEEMLTQKVIELVLASACLPLCSLGSLWLNCSV
jgi:hypothetical protein